MTHPQRANQTVDSCHKARPLLLGVATVVGLSLTLTTHAADRLVPQSYATIQAAIDASDDGDEIIVSPGTYEETLALSGRALVIRSTGGPEATTLAAAGERCLVMEGPEPNGAGVRLQGFTLTGGDAEEGGAILVRYDALSLVDCTATGNTADEGGVLNSLFGTITLSNCRFFGNNATSEGGVIRTSETALLFEDCIITDNTSAGEGGSLWLFYSDIVMNDCTIRENQASERGGGVYVYKGTLDMNQTTVTDNQGGSGGGVFVDKTNALVRACTITDNVATASGGGICWASRADGDMRNTMIRGNSAQFGAGGVWLSDSNVDIDDCRIEENDGASGVGGVEVVSGDPVISNSAFCGNGSDIAGDWINGGNNSFSAACRSTCIGDLDGNGIVDGADLSILLGDWGPCTPDAPCPGDIDGNGQVDGADLSTLLGAWGPCQGG